MLCEDFVELSDSLRHLTVLAEGYGVVRDEDSGFQSGHLRCVELVRDGFFGEEELGFGMGHQHLHALGVELMEDGNHHGTIMQAGEEGDGPGG